MLSNWSTASLQSLSGAAASHNVAFHASGQLPQRHGSYIFLPAYAYYSGPLDRYLQL